MSAGTVLVRCDVGPASGVGHLMRCVALGEEFAARGYRLVFAAEADTIPWAAAQVARRGFELIAPPKDTAGEVALLAGLRPGVVVVDSYLLPVQAYAAMRAALQPAGVPLLAMVDGPVAGRVADLYLDQNLGAPHDPPRPPGSVWLGGVRYALMRDEVVRNRPEARPVRRDSAVPSVLAFFGGTDPRGVATRIAAALVATGRPWRATVVCARPEIQRQVRALPTGAGQTLIPIGPTDELAGLAARSDLVVSAAGTSSWELLCLGAATAMVCVADNQADAYRRLTGSGLTRGLGTAADLESDAAPASSTLGQLLSDAAARHELAVRGWSLVDGRGRGRVADAVLAYAGSDAR